MKTEEQKPPAAERLRLFKNHLMLVRIHPSLLNGCEILRRQLHAGQIHAFYAKSPGSICPEILLKAFQLFSVQDFCHSFQF